MEAYNGHVEDGKIVMEGMPRVPDGCKVIVTVLDLPPEEVTLRRQKAFLKFIEKLRECDEPLSPVFDEVISQRVNFTRELDLG